MRLPASALVIKKKSMRQVNIRDFRKDMSVYLEDLPYALTRYGKVIAIIREPEVEGEVPEEVVQQPVEDVQEPKKPISATALGKTQAEVTAEAMEHLSDVLSMAVKGIS